MARLKNESLENIIIGNPWPTAEPRWFPFSPREQPVIEAAEYGVVPDTFMHMVDVSDRDWDRSNDGYLRRPSNPTG